MEHAPPPSFGLRRYRRILHASVTSSRPQIRTPVCAGRWLLVTHQTFQRSWYVCASRRLIHWCISRRMTHRSVSSRHRDATPQAVRASPLGCHPNDCALSGFLSGRAVGRAPRAGAGAERGDPVPASHRSAGRDAPRRWLPADLRSRARTERQALLLRGHLRRAQRAQVSQPTAKAWVSILETRFVVFRLPALHGNLLVIEQPDGLALVEATASQTRRPACSTPLGGRAASFPTLGAPGRNHRGSRWRRDAAALGWEVGVLGESASGALESMDRSPSRAVSSARRRTRRQARRARRRSFRR